MIKREFNRNRGLASAALLVFTFGCTEETKRVSPEEMSTFQADFEAFKGALNTDEQAWRAEVQRLATLPLPASEAPCSEAADGILDAITVRLPALSEAMPKHLENRALAVKSIDRIWGSVSAEGKALPTSTHTMLRQKLDADAPTAKSELVLVVESEKMPKMISADTFDPGFIRGRLLVWSGTDGKFTCAGPAVGESDESLKSHGNNADSVQDNLEYRTRKNAIVDLRALP